MAYVKKEDLVTINVDEGNLSALVTEIQFRKFKKWFKDKATGEKRYRLKSVPYAVCMITTSTGKLSKYSIGKKFIIPGYKLKNHVMKGQKCLMLQNEYLADFEQNGEAWVVDMINSSKNKSKKKEQKDDV